VTSATEVRPASGEDGDTMLVFGGVTKEVAHLDTREVVIVKSSVVDVPPVPVPDVGGRDIGPEGDAIVGSSPTRSAQELFRVDV